MDFRSAIAEIRRNGRDPNWWYGRFLDRVVGGYYERFGPTQGTPVVDLDWDNLLILDGCRYDVFEEVYEDQPLPGQLGARIAANSATRGFLFDNFTGGSFEDVVYVTGNAWVNIELDVDSFHHVIPVWRDGWDEPLGTVRPETMVEFALEAAERFPRKRLIVHFMQPHGPFIGDVRIADTVGSNSHIRQMAMGDEPGDSPPGVFKLLRSGKISRNEAWAAYRSNLERVFPAVEQLMETLEGLTLVTADHGEAFGEWAKPFPIRIYGHPAKNLRLPSLVRVPSLVYENGPRRDIIAERGPGSEDITDRELETALNRLEQLGYAE
jgi:hypothetical protein